MARFSEGDRRWFAEERPDGANVHNRHWAERDCLEWSRFRLSCLLQNLPILGGEGGVTIKTKSLDKLEGEAYVNIRKGKIIPGYELSLSLSWEGEVLPISGGGDVAAVRVAGSVEVPHLAYDNANGDPEVRIAVKEQDGPVGARIRDAFAAKGKLVVLEKVKEYVRAMAQGGPAKDELELKEHKAAEGEKAVGGVISGGDEDAALPRDARIVKALLKSMGVESYEPCVIHQFLELWYRYVVDVLTDAQIYSEHASKSSIDVDDIKLAIQNRVNSSYSQPPPREVLMELARNRNKVPLPKSIVGAGIPLPPEQDTLINPNYQLLIPKRQALQVAEIEEEEEMVSADNRNPVSSPQANASSVQERQLQQRVSFQMTAGKRAR